MRQQASTDIKRDLVGLLPRMRRFAMTLTRETGEADDLVQEVCKRVIAKSHLWNGEGRLDSWIYTMIRNVWVNEIKKHKARAGAAPLDAADWRDLILDPSAEKAVYSDQLHRMVACMPEGLASAFVLVSIEGRSYRETAEILGIPASTVMSRLSTARLHLAAMTAGGKERRA